MIRSVLFSLVVAALFTTSAFAQVGAPGVYYSGSIAAGDGGQLYPFDRQDPWIHGHYQRIPAYGGYASFRPYNYHHVFSQTQMAGRTGASHGMPYSQQYWNKYRGSYLNENLHSPSMTSTPNLGVGGTVGYQATPLMSSPSAPISQTGWSAESPVRRTVRPQGQPVHVFPNSAGR
ncbi:MAG: hypothetical protein KDA85_06690 [Planctomycetaceae bacterium]|nr:hypothetical protein [Planctomycetaceae bacterium]